MVSAFFYGTLMHPEILKRVIGNDGNQLQMCSALLLDYTRHQVKDEDYPAILPYSQSRTMFDHDLDFEEKSVRGSLVTGLSEEDIRLLDVFEGNQYTREVVSVYPLAPLANIRDIPPIEVKSLVPATSPPIPILSSLANTVEADTYVWCLSSSELWAQLWSFEEFVKHNAWKWVGSSSANNKDYDEVDRRRGMEGIIVQAGLT
ncbi:uncharacterized protein EDB91DRAFT_1159188 [Suillus paluster]|uniref:uncharacterized protein n=1 Tax=Suillus paluster TaxID=48578 RepID=UPI001B868978|nr:uncharacterized protein EDB91DRAFT_1159188 [Suillus paluster]KAG1729660.1 hypothetical protein EDB91DRAFT_1159188 [Suillus paluster]